MVAITMMLRLKLEEKENTKYPRIWSQRELIGMHYSCLNNVLLMFCVAGTTKLTNQLQSKKR